MTKAEQIESKARKLLAAMDRQYGSPLFSLRVEQARNELRQLVPNKPDERDRSRARIEAA